MMISEAEIIKGVIIEGFKFGLWGGFLCFGLSYVIQIFKDYS